jgi:hypothetical protein
MSDETPSQAEGDRDDELDQLQDRGRQPGGDDTGAPRAAPSQAEGDTEGGGHTDR